MENESLNAKSMELIRKTKEFLQLNKTFDDLQSILVLISQAKPNQVSAESWKIVALPDKVRELIKSAGNLDKAENLTLNRMRELKERLGELSKEIRKLSDQLEPYSNRPKSTVMEERK